MGQSETSAAQKERAQAIVENVLTKAYPRGWQRRYVAGVIVHDLAEAGLLDVTGRGQERHRYAQDDVRG